MTAYLGGKHRQGPVIAEFVARLRGKKTTYVEPFHGMMGVASRVARLCPDLPQDLSDANQFVVTLWQHLVFKDWQPPSKEQVTQRLWDRYKKKKPKDDPLTAYLGFGASFMGLWFQNSKCWPKGPTFTLRKTRDLKLAKKMRIRCSDFAMVWPEDSIVYLDPPYVGHARQSLKPKEDAFTFEHEFYLAWVQEITKRKYRNVVLATAFEPYAGVKCETLHEWGDTMSRPVNLDAAKVVNERLMRLR